MSLPVDFEAKLKAPPSSIGGYPSQISASDLMRNFVYAAGEFNEEEFEVTDSNGESSPHTTRKISLKSPLVGTDQGDVPFWNKSLNENSGGWQMVKPSGNGTMIYYSAAAKVWRTVTPTGDGTMVYWSEEEKEWKKVTPTDKSIIYFKDKKWHSLPAPEEGTLVLGSKDGVIQWLATEEC